MSNYKKLLGFLADLSLKAGSLEIARAALKLQSALIKHYGKPL